MHFVPLMVFDNYVSAHIALGCLKDNEIDCWLKDENTVTIDPILTNAIGGIKLMVDDTKAAAAAELLNQLRDDHRSRLSCIKCGSTNIEWVSSPRKPLTWLTALSTFLLGDYAVPSDKVYHCFDCGHESETAVKTHDDPTLN